MALAERGYAVIWIGANEDRDVNRRLARQVGMDASGAFNLLELAALGRRAEFAVVNDSAPMHILSASPLPVYALFGPTDWRRSHGLGQAERVLLNPVACSPCHRPVCPPGFDHRCLNELTPGTCWRASRRTDGSAVLNRTTMTTKRCLLIILENHRLCRGTPKG